MNCPKCGKLIEGLACPACTALQSREAVFRQQGMHLESVRSGRLPFYSKRLSGRHPWHLMLFGARSHSFCGVEFPQVGHRNRTEIRYAQLEELMRSKALCVQCLRALKGIEEAEAIREES